ncbi:MAG TPA: PQQ-dependent sugar dehydrogenase [Candidatus Methanoperedens sp.]|nr:PQQ-dependent sugar dehydrogenase [Candidatus Methanoperedens sp.]
MRLHRMTVAVFLLSTAACGVFLPPKGCGTEIPLGSITLPPGFSISLYAQGVPGARSLALGDRGTVFVGTREEGKVYALLPAPDGSWAARVLTVAAGLEMPNGVAFRDGALYVAEVSRVIRFDGIETRLADPPRPVVVDASFPAKTHHGWIFIRFGPDGLLYVPVGAPCNVCLEKDPRFASIMRMRPDGSGLEVFASGVRNSVGFDWDPATGALWFTDNGRDWLGDDTPDDELNRATAPGLHFGFPFCHGGDLADPEYGRLRSCADFVPPLLGLGAHVAALGMRFYSGSQFPPEYRGSIFIAEHGSWNRTSPVGYRIVRVRVEGGRVADAEVFAEGWLQGARAWGRPVDVMVLPDGALLVSDDRAGAVYRIGYTGR